VIRLAVRVARAQAEVALAELLALAPAGVEETDLGELVEYAVYGAPGELPALPDLRAAAGDALVEISTDEVADDWAERWRAFHRPVTVRNRVHVRPPWAPAPEPRGGLVDLVIEPGRAFGTGAHATTRLCLGLLLDLEPGGALADLGCGSGVLAIAAARLGWSPVLAVDHEEASVEAAAANARRNRAGVGTRRVDLLGGPPPHARTVVANLTGPLLRTVAARMERAPGHLVVSGLLRAEAGDVAAAFGRLGLRERRRTSEGEWVGLRLEARGG
jgi:ribosomal protein L11 methyltransferase